MQPALSMIKIMGTVHLKVPKREIFVTELFTLSDPIWIGDMRIEPKKLFVLSVRLILAILVFFTDD
jgi:hypothetical protein